MKDSKIIPFKWAWKKLREYLRQNCIDIQTIKLGDLKYCLEKYFETVGRKKPNKKSTVLLFSEYNNVNSPIYKGIRVPGLTLKKESLKAKKTKYRIYLNSKKWRAFKKSVLKKRGNICERCKLETEKLDLHHKTYARLFNELPEDVELLCRSCHEIEHDKKIA